MTEAKNQKSTARQAADLFDKVQRLRAEKIEAIAEAGRKAEERFNKRIVEALDGASGEVLAIVDEMDARLNGTGPLMRSGTKEETTDS